MGRPDQADLTPRLLRLGIENVGLIERADVEFADGFTAFTGETGSGKTMLLGALEAALGGRVDRELVRGERARVTLLVAPNDELRARLAENGIEADDDDDVVIVREIAAAGRSTARVNGVAVSAGQLRALGDALVDAIGQGEAQRLLEPAFARELLDRVGGEEVAALRARLRARFEERRRLAAERDALRDGGERIRADHELARFALVEIDGAAIAADDEDERLRERRDVLSNAARVAENLARARAAIEDERGAIDAAGDAAHALAALARFGPSFAQLAESATAVQGELNALGAAVARLADEVELDPHELDAVTARLDALESLKRKYGGSLAAVGVARARFAAAIEADLGRDERLTELDARVAELDAAIATSAAALHEQRVAFAPQAADRVSDELRALAMPSARFAVAVEPLGEIAAHGSDRVEFRFSANPGEPERPLARIASGGERSRVLLALVVALAGERSGRTFVFDEIDAGIGGATAVAVGQRLGRLAQAAQVICVTHLAQIASVAERHYALRKEDDGEATTIRVIPLAADERRLEEIARMLSGDTTALSMQHAAALIASSGKPVEL